MSDNINWKELIERDLLPGEIIRPIWDIRIKWSVDIVEKHLNIYCNKEGNVLPECLWKFENLPEGRWWESTSWQYMPKEILTAEEVEVEFGDKWKLQGFKQQKEKGKNPELDSIKITHYMDEVWCSSWFSHWTYDIGLDDGSVLNSFSLYVDRIQRMNRELGEVIYTDKKNNMGHWHEPYCLMGAEDRHRWKGRKPADNELEYKQVEPPCRCEECKSSGIVRIYH